jgi:gluconolactonase
MFGDIEGAGFALLDERFNRCFVGHVAVERLWTGGRWLEGPAWFAAGRYLVFSDIPNNRMMRFDETDGSVSEFRKPSNNSNGNTVDHEGRLVSCEHLSRRVTRTNHDGSITVIADSYKGKRLNSPNDVAVRSDGTVWSPTGLWHRHGLRGRAGRARTGRLPRLLRRSSQRGSRAGGG